MNQTNPGASFEIAEAARQAQQEHEFAWEHRNTGDIFTESDIEAWQKRKEELIKEGQDDRGKQGS